MGKVSKKASEKHNVSLSPALADFIRTTCSIPLVDLPSHLASLPTRWPFPRGDLYNWIEPLDRFDSILQSFNEKYGLSSGPQTQNFGSTLLLESLDGNAAEQLQQKGFGPEGDREVIESILAFSRLLLEKCGNRALYNSTDRLNDLLNTTSLNLLHGTLRITIFLAQRHAERSTHTPQPHSQFYNFDHERLYKLTTAFAQPTSQLNKRQPTSPVKKSAQAKSGRRKSTSVNPNDFRSLLRANTHVNGTGKSKAAQHDPDWQPWANFKIVWTAPNSEANDQMYSKSQEIPSTPTPVRRPSSLLSRTPTSASTAEVDPATMASTVSEHPGMQVIELTASDLLATTPEGVLHESPQDMPRLTKYDMLHKLRIAYGLMTSAESRLLLLQVRLLALAIVAYICDEHEFHTKVFGTESSSSVRQQLIYQIAGLLQDNKKSQENVSSYLQTLAMESLEVLARQRVLSGEIMSALAPNSSHGLLLSLTQKGLADLKHDGDETDNSVGDDWREAVFSLLSAFMIHGIHSVRSSENIINPSLVVAYASGLKIMTDKALRIHLRILDFMKTFFHHFKDGLTVLSANHAFEAACELLDNLSKSSLDLLQAGHGIRQEFKTKVTDYQIPYMHQQVIRSMIDLVNDIIGHQGAHAERILRNLVDSQTLLNAFQAILSNIQAFGAHTWSEVVKAIVGFLHNEPTSYTIISEAGIIKTLLGMLSISAENSQTPAHRTVSVISKRTTLLIPAVADAVINLSQAFGAICLTSTGFDHFKNSGALERFFEIFESPAHVKVLKDANTLALLGSTFDELVRHHPSLKNAVLSNVITMIARVRYICQSRAWQIGAGPKLWLESQASGLTVSGGIQSLIAEVIPLPQTEATTYKPLKLPDGTTLDVNGPIIQPDKSLISGAKDVDAEGLSVADYARPAICFLMNFFENQAMCTAFMDTGASDLILDFTTLSSFSPDEQTFGPTNAPVRELTNVIHMMAETKPHLVLPTMVDRAKYACEEGLRDLVNPHSHPDTCIFEPFIRRSAAEEDMQVDMLPVNDITTQGTHLVKGLTTTLLLVQVLAEVFNLPLYSNRSATNILFQQVNIADMIADLCRSLGLLSATCYREEIALQRRIPEAWLPGTKPGNFTTGDDEVDKILQVFDSSATSTDQSEQLRVGEQDLKSEKQTIQYRNAQTLRYLLIETPNSITEFFLHLGRGVANKRRMETFAKQKASLVADALADAYTVQLQPPFLSDEVPADNDAKHNRFEYLSCALSNVRGSLYDDSPSMGPSSSRQAFVIDAFRRARGLKILTKIGTEFFAELTGRNYARSVFAANAGLKICLDIFDDLTNAKNVVESNQASHWRNNDLARPFYFNPSQLLLELRMEALPLTRLVWDSDYADQASNDVVQKLVSILKHVFNGDHETEAVQTSAGHPQLSEHTKRKYHVDTFKVTSLKEKGFSDDLITEALYRCNVSSTATITSAEEYCKTMQDNPRRRRLPFPAGEADSGSVPATSGIRSPMNAPFTNPTTLFSNQGGIETTLAEVVSHLTDNDMEDIDNADDLEDEDDNEDDNDGDGDRPTEESGSTQITSTSAMNINNILNQPGTTQTTQRSSQPPPTKPTPVSYSVETIDAERESIREELPERCNNILNNHQNLTFELSELIMSGSKKLTEDATKVFWENTSDLLVNSLLSMQPEDGMSELHGKKVAAAAHMTALLIQDNDVFKMTLKTFQDSFDGLLSFLQLPSIVGKMGEEPSSPWVAPILLIIERMLSLDTEPAEIKWSAPSDMEVSQEPKLTHQPVFDIRQKSEVFNVLVGLLPRVGKDKSMALSIVRVLVILTRTRQIAVMQGLRGNLQRLFLMIKQLGSAAQGRLQTTFMLVLRHIVEDDETIKQIMRSEIVASLANRSSGRQIDLTSFIRDNYHLVLRSPELFVEVANEKIKFSGWSPHTANQALTLKNNAEGEPATSQEDAHSPKLRNDSEPSNEPAASIEDQENADKSKSTEIRPPIVENPDGLVHFLLSELLAYKDVDDKEPTATADSAIAIVAESATNNNAEENTQTPSIVAPSTSSNSEKQDKPKYKADDHPIFLYRGFILQCLTELLYSYNRTKIEFINFSRKADPMAVTPSKPRSGVLNYMLNALVCSGYVEKDETLACRKRMFTSDWAVKVVVALCTKTGETGLAGSAQRYSSHSQIDDEDSEPDLTFVRRFTLEHVIKAFKDATTSMEPLQTKYGRLLCLSDLFNKLLSKPSGPEGSAGSHNNSYKMLGRMMFEKNLVSVLTSSLAEIDLAFPAAKKVIKFILRPLQELTSLAVHLSLNSTDTITSAMGNDLDDVISSASSVSEMGDQREETPDLFRNSVLGMVDPGRQDTSDTSEDEDDDDEEMYDEEYEDEMDYDEGMPAPNDGEVVSDEELDEALEEVGPIEGLPGDHPMDVEFVMDDHLGIHGSDEDDEDEDDEDDDDDEDDEDNDDFEVEMDDVEGEINDDDNENDSLGDVPDGEEDWEDEDDEDEDDDNDDQAEITFGGEELPIPVEFAANNATRPELNQLLRVLGEQDLNDEGSPIPPLPHQILIEADQRSDRDREEEDDEDEDDDEVDDEDELDENGEMEYDDGFNAMLDGPDDFGRNQWGWDEPPPTMFRRHRQSGPLSRGPLPFPINRRIHTLDSDFHQHMMAGHPAVMGARHHRHAPPARVGADDGTNPLLQRPPNTQNSRSNVGQPFSVTLTTDGMPGGLGLPGLPSIGGGNMISMQIPMGPGFSSPDLNGAGGHGAVLDALLNALNGSARGMIGDGSFPPEGLRFSLSGTGDIREMIRTLGPPGHVHEYGRSTRDDTARVTSFIPMMTSNRWQEEARMLFGNTYVDKIQRVQILLMSKLVPLAQEEEKIRRQKKAEEDERRRREAEELDAQKELRIQREREQREAAEKEEADAKARAEAEALATTAVTISADDTAEGGESAPELMEGVQTENQEADTDAAPPSESAPEPQRVFTTIRGRQLDITGLDIDLGFLEAIPEDMREEVIMTQYTARREAATQNEGSNDVSTIDPDFLDALPEDIREEIRQQEAHLQRRRDREAARRQQATVGTNQAEEMDNDNFLATLDPALRRAILAEQPPEILQQLDPRHAAEGRAHQRGLLFHRMADGRDPRDERARRDVNQREKRQVVQLIDKAGVATLLRLMFLPQQGSMRSNLWQILSNVCGNRQTRFEVISLLLVILKEGSTDVNAVERSLASLSLRAKASGSQKTPQSLKRTLSMQPQAVLSQDMTPIVVVQQCLASLQALCRLGLHVKIIFLREIDVATTKNSRKGKGKENKTTKYPINDLISLLDRRLIMESSASLTALSELLASVTGPLKILMQKEIEQPKIDTPTKAPTEKGVRTDHEQDASTVTEPEQSPTSTRDTSMTEAPSAAGEGLVPGVSSSTEQQSISIDINNHTAEPSNKEDDLKRKQPFEPPEISEHNLQLITSVFVASECHNETFHSILATLSSLSCIPGTSSIFSKELINHVQILSQAISADLSELLPLIREAQSTSDLQGVTSVKFSASSSDQVKLLRVLQALDFLSAPKKDTDDESVTVKSILNSSYDNLSLGPLWHKLSECLTAVREKGDTIGFANILLPLIESLMVVCKNTPLKDAPVAAEIQESLASPKPEAMNDLEELFFNFTTEHRKILNDIVRQNPKLMQGEGSFSLLVKNSKVLDFDNKRNYFTKQIHSRHHTQRHVQPPLQLSVRRSNIFIESYKGLYFKSAEEMKYGKLNIRFTGEEGVDAGGVTREWFQVLARSMFDANYALFQPVASDRTTFHPSALSGVNEEHLQYFKFIGRIIGKALHEGRVLDCHFSRAVYKRILGKSPNLKDLESNDVDYYKSLVWILENDITDILTEEFCVIESNFGEDKIIDLIPDGRNIPVTEENKKDYVQKLVEYRLTESVKDQLDSFLQGFHDIIPAELVSIFNEQELELLISGLPEVDVDDWKANTEYHNYSPSSSQIVWFWRIVRGMTNEERAKLLQFITGTSKVPLNGFKELEGVSGLTRFNIHKDPSTNRLPTSHTCFNQLDLPTYNTFEIMKQQLMTAINLGADYFGFA